MLRSLNVSDGGFWALPNKTKLEDRLAGLKTEPTVEVTLHSALHNDLG